MNSALTNLQRFTEIYFFSNTAKSSLLKMEGFRTFFGDAGSERDKSNDRDFLYRFHGHKT